LITCASADGCWVEVFGNPDAQISRDLQLFQLGGVRRLMDAYKNGWSFMCRATLSLARSMKSSINRCASNDRRRRMSWDGRSNPGDHVRFGKIKSSDPRPNRFARRSFANFPIACHV